MSDKTIKRVDPVPVPKLSPEQQLDEALKESFPASDPPSVAQPHTKKDNA